MKTFLISGALLFSSVALAENHHPHTAPDQPAAMTEAGKEYMSGMQAMHDGMMVSASFKPSFASLSCFRY